MFIDALKDAVIALFASFPDREDCKAVAETLKNTAVEFGFPRNGNVTVHKSAVEALRGEPSKRVSLDKLSDGSAVIIVQRMQADSVRDVFASLIHGAILAWRKASGARTKDGKERLIDEAFTSCAQFVGLCKVADKRTVVKDGIASTAKVSDSTARVWFGLSAALQAQADKFAESAPPLPVSFVGTEANDRIGTLLLPATVTLRNGGKLATFVRIPSWTAALRKVAEGKAAVNEARKVFEEYRDNADLEFNVKNKGFRLMVSLIEAETRAAEPEPEPEPETPKPPAKPKAKPVK